MNASNAAPVPMTDEQKFFFDLRGWILLPGVLTQDEIEAMKAEAYSADIAKNQQATNPRQSYQGNLQTLLDHPAVAGILAEILAEEPFLSDNYHAFRCENSFITVRPPGWSKQAVGGKIFAGLTRVVWELEEVKAGQGGTSFLSGSHKAHFSYGGPDRYRPNISDSSWEDNIRGMMEDYSCPAGSAVIFTESLLHAANDWTNPDNPRCAVFNCYNSLWAQWHRLNLEHEIIEAMPPKRRSLFRGVWQIGGENHAYSSENRSL